MTITGTSPLGLDLPGTCDEGWAFEWSSMSCRPMATCPDGQGLVYDSDDRPIPGSCHPCQHPWQVTRRPEQDPTGRDTFMPFACGCPMGQKVVMDGPEIVGCAPPRDVDLVSSLTAWQSAPTRLEAGIDVPPPAPAPAPPPPPVTAPPPPPGNSPSLSPYLIALLVAGGVYWATRRLRQKRRWQSA